MSVAHGSYKASISGYAKGSVRGSHDQGHVRSQYGDPFHEDSSVYGRDESPLVLRSSQVVLLLVIQRLSRIYSRRDLTYSTGAPNYFGTQSHHKRKL